MSCKLFRCFYPDRDSSTVETTQVAHRASQEHNSNAAKNTTQREGGTQPLESAIEAALPLNDKTSSVRARAQRQRTSECIQIPLQQQTGVPKISCLRHALLEKLPGVPRSIAHLKPAGIKRCDDASKRPVDHTYASPAVTTQKSRKTS